MFGAHDDYSSDSVPDIIAGAHERTMVVLIESAKGIANAEEIMSVPGVDVAHLGHVTISLCPSKFQETQPTRLCRKVSTPSWRPVRLMENSACLAGSVDTGIDWVRRGFRMVSYSYDIGLMTAALQSGIEQIHRS